MGEYLKAMEAKSKISEIVIFLLKKFNLSFIQSFIASAIFSLKDSDAIEIYERIKEVIEK
jgi:hypothetical protein